MPTESRAITALMHELIDYGGLFPPSAHNMVEAVRRYARYRVGSFAGFLGRFLVPAARLVECEQALAALGPAARGGGAWRLAALVAPPWGRQFESIAAFNDRGTGGHDFHAVVDSVEAKVASPEDVGRLASLVPREVRAFFECTSSDSRDAVLAAVRDAGGSAKIRTGGVVPGTVAAPAAIAAFVAGCAALDVPFKATAGLHHAVRATRALTYEPDAPRVVMNGFLNVFVAAVLARARRLDAASVLPILEETDGRAFGFSDAGVSWRGRDATVAETAAARRFAVSFGSCSFDEPIDDLVAMGLIA